MFFSFNDEGRVMISALKPIYPGMVELTPPDGFDDEHQPDWIYSGGAWVHAPLPAPDDGEAQPGYDERISALEEELAAAKILLGVSE